MLDSLKTSWFVNAQDGDARMKTRIFVSYTFDELIGSDEISLDVGIL